MSTSQLHCCLLVLNYNGINHLDDCLSTAWIAAQAVNPPCPVICVDNASSDGSVEYTQKHFPGIEIVSMKKNNFLFSLNEVVEKRKEDVVIILNNDMRFSPDFIPPLLKHFKNPEIFAATSAIFDWSGHRITTGQRRAKIRNFWFYKHWDLHKQTTCFTLEACGGASAFRRNMFLELGGFDSLYAPAYYEDFDLSFRAWQHGWKTIYEPSSKVFHKESANMIEKYGQNETSQLIQRNHVLFTAKNIGSWFFLLFFLLLLPLRALRPLLAGNSLPLHSISSAIPNLFQAILRRFKKKTVRKTAEFSELFQD